jgi:methionyl-tRNA formyltransferase
VKDKIKIFLIGSGKIGIRSFAKIAADGRFLIVGMATQEDKVSGRKLIPAPMPVAEWAERNSIPIEKVKSVNDPNFVKKVKDLKTDIIFLASFGQILKEDILTAPLREPVNLHSSLLPKFRGASPIQAAIISGEKETGVSFMRMEKGLDSGPVFAKFAIPIADDDNFQTLEGKLASVAAEHVVDVIQKIFDGTLDALDQDHQIANFAPKIKKSDGLINWNESAELIERKIRAFSTWPGVFFDFETEKKKMRIKINGARVVRDFPQNNPGKMTLSSQKWIVSCGNFAIELLRVHPEGKKEMGVGDFLRGYRMPVSVQ